MKKILLIHFIFCLVLCYATGKENDIWDIDSLYRVPEVDDAPGYSTNGVKAVFYKGLSWKGRPTRVFAYYGIPTTKNGEKVPAMVLVHGGGGSAFVPWVRLWLDRGYAAIAMDTCGCISGGGYQNHPRHEDGGPAGWGGFGQIDDPVGDQWTYHAVADVILAHSLIRSFPGVDQDRTGITGISWGGYLTCIVAGVDHRFKFAAPVYGCGFLGDNSTWLNVFKGMGDEKAARWLGMWDPSRYLEHADMPMLWVTGSNDFAYPMDSLQKSYRLPKSARTLCVRLRMPHGHGGAGENPEEIRVMAENVFSGGVPLVKITGTGRNGSNVWVSCTGQAAVAGADLNYTTNSGSWKERTWLSIPAVLDSTRRKAAAVLPEETTVYYFNLLDERSLIVSSEHEEIQQPVKNP